MTDQPTTTGRKVAKAVAVLHRAGFLDSASILSAEIARLTSRFTAPVVCMCGSTRFKQTWLSENARLTLKGDIVLSVAMWNSHERIEPDEATKRFLDDGHKRKIDLCDWVWVLDVGGYIGESTRSEIAYAEAHGKPVRYLSQEFPGYVEPEDPLAAERLAHEQTKASLADAQGIVLDATEARVQAEKERDRLINWVTGRCDLCPVWHRGCSTGNPCREDVLAWARGED